jgi:hypothetical protein
MNPVIHRFLAHYQPYKKLFVLDFSCAVVAAVLELSFPVFVNQVIDKLLPGNNWPLIVIACTAYSDSGRGDLGARYRDRAPHSAVARRAVGRSHDADHRAPACDD